MQSAHTASEKAKVVNEGTHTWNKNRHTAPGAHDYMFGCTHTCFHTQANTWRYCELCMLASRIQPTNMFAGSVVSALWLRSSHLWGRRETHVRKCTCEKKKK